MLLVAKVLRFGMQMGKQKSQYDEETTVSWKSQISKFQLIWTIKKVTLNSNSETFVLLFRKLWNNHCAHCFMRKPFHGTKNVVRGLMDWEG
jgi:hypothetical protein